MNYRIISSDLQSSSSQGYQVLQWNVFASYSQMEIVPSSPVDFASGYKSELSSMESNLSSNINNSFERDVNAVVGTPFTVSFSQEVQVEVDSEDSPPPMTSDSLRQQPQVRSLLCLLTE